MSAGTSHRSLAAARALAVDIKLTHSVFALPFALLGAFMAARPSGAVIDWRRLAGQLVLVVLAMITARTVAMLANRLLDRRIDELNPRTAGRALPSGRVTPGAAVGALLVATAGFVAVCSGFGWWFGNWWPAWLSVPVLAWLAAYPLLKRFTALCHVYLGASLAISPVAAALAIDPAAVAGQPALWLLSAMVLGWVAGFDVIYALQDLDADRLHGLHSLPSRLGPGRALVVARLLHLGAAACLVGVVMVDRRFGLAFAAGAATVIVLLVYEHRTVARWGTTRLALAFFTLNGVISCVLGAVGIVDLVLI